MEREERPTTRLDTREMFDLPTATIARDQLIDLVEQTIEPAPFQHVHTVPREQLKPAAPPPAPVRDDLDAYDSYDVAGVDLRPSVMPFVWYGLILALAVVFIAAVQLT